MALPDLGRPGHVSPGIGEQSLDDLGAMTEPNVDATFQNPLAEAHEADLKDLAAQAQEPEQEPEPGYWSQFFNSMADGLAPALVAWAAEKFQSPLIYQAYAQQKTQELADAKWKAEQEIEQAKLDAQTRKEQEDAEHRERVHQLNVISKQMDLTQQARNYNASEIGDVQEWSATMGGMALHAAALGMDPEVFITSNPFPKIKQVQKMIEVLEHHMQNYKGDPRALMMANIPNLISPEGGWISGIELARQVGMIDLETGFVMPIGLTGTDDIETVSPDGTRYVTQVTPYQRGAYGTQVRHKTPEDLGVEFRESGRLQDGSVIYTIFDKKTGAIVGFNTSPGGTPEIPEDEFASLFGGDSEYEQKMQTARESIGAFLQQQGLSPENAAKMMNEQLTPLHLIHFANNPYMPIPQLFEEGFIPTRSVGGGGF